MALLSIVDYLINKYWKVTVVIGQDRSLLLILIIFLQFLLLRLRKIFSEIIMENEL